jgi:hypothetical protein
MKKLVDIVKTEAGIPTIEGLPVTYANKKIREEIQDWLAEGNFTLPAKYTYEVVDGLDRKVAKIKVAPKVRAYSYDFSLLIEKDAYSWNCLLWRDATKLLFGIRIGTLYEKYIELEIGNWSRIFYFRKKK